MQKSYEVNYTGLKSEGFITWLIACKMYLVGKQAVNVVQEKKLSTQLPVPKVTTTVVNSNVRFTYVSPSEFNNILSE
jgi:hypothetical protein